MIKKYRFATCVALLLCLNALMVWVTQQQRTTWIGHVESSMHNKTTQIDQHQDDLTIRVVYYIPQTLRLDYENRYFEYAFSQRTPNSYIITNDKMDIKLSLHRFFALDDQSG